MKGKSKILLWTVSVMTILVVLVFYEYGYKGVSEALREAENKYQTESHTLAKYMTMIAERPGMERELVMLTERKRTEGNKTIEGRTPFSAAAVLQSTIKGILTARGGTIASDRSENPADAGRFKVVTVVVDAIMPDIAALNDALYTIETQRPYVVIREIDVRIRDFQNPKELVVKLRVSGLTGGS
ncbi:MAG: type II secretion system protein GspM [Smithellaceae bacterium]|nr:type II secretion system protein GspM [Smithellaceae bacterium]